jgi:hypothetical protein
MQAHSTPETPRLNIVRPTDGIEGINKILQFRYRSGVGMLLYMIKNSRPDIANFVRELSKSLDSAAIAAYKEMLRVTKFVLNTESFCLKIEPKADEKDWDLVVYSNSDWVRDTENQIIITGFITFLLGVPLC